MAILMVEVTEAIKIGPRMEEPSVEVNSHLKDAAIHESPLQASVHFIEPKLRDTGFSVPDSTRITPAIRLASKPRPEGLSWLFDVPSTRDAKYERLFDIRRYGIALPEGIEQCEVSVYDITDQDGTKKRQSFHPGQDSNLPEIQVVSVAGVSRLTKYPKTRAAYGVHYADGGENFSGPLPSSTLKQSYKSAEFHAVEKALLAISPSARDLELVIASDDKYVVRALTSLVHVWGKNEYLNGFKEEVKEREVIERIDRMLVELHKSRNVRVRFWAITKDDNLEAESLAVNELVRADYSG